MDGKTLFSHSYRRPLVTLSVSSDRPSRRRGQPPARKLLFVQKARTWKLVTQRPDFLELHFEGVCRLAVRERGGALALSFSRYDSAAGALDLRLPGTPGETVFASVPGRENLDIKGWRWRPDGGGPAEEPLSALIGGRVWLTADLPAEMDCRSGSYIVVRFRGIPKTLTLGACHNLSGAAGALRQSLGASPEPPAWLYDGLCVTVAGGAEEAYRRVNAMLGSGVRVGALALADWQGGQNERNPHSWEPDRSLYPSIRDELGRYREAGIHSFLSMGAFLGAGTTVAQEAGARGFLLKDRDGGSYRVGRDRALVLPDLWNPDAASWVGKTLAAALAGTGASGVIELQAPVPPADAVGAAGPCWGRIHEYGKLWSAAIKAAVDDSGLAGRAAVFRYAARPSAWDTGSWSPWKAESGGKGLVHGLYAALVGGGSWHAELSAAGVGSARGRELFMRGMETLAAGPYLRIGGDGPWWSHPGLRTHAARVSELWAGLAPYHRSVAAELASFGLAPLRPVAMQYPKDNLAFDGQARWLYGRDLFCGGPVRPGKDLADVELPDDHWVHMWSSREFRGGPVTIEAPVGFPPLFYRADSLWASRFDDIRKAHIRASEAGR